MLSRKLIAVFLLALCSLLFAQEDEARIKKLIEELASDSLKACEKATDELITFGEKAKKFIEEALKETNDPEIKSCAEIILKTIHVRSLVGEEVYKKMPDKIKAFAISTDAIERLKILKEIKEEGKVSDDKLRPLGEMIAMDASKIEGKENKEFIITFIKENKLRSASKLLVKLLEDQNGNVRWNAAEALGKLGAKEYAKDIAKLLENQDAGVRGDAAVALGQLGAKEYAKDIAKLLEDQVAWVRGRAALALGDLESTEYAKDIAKLLKDKDKWVRGAALIALGSLEVNEYANDIAKLLVDKEANVRADAAWALGMLEAKEYMNDIAKLLEDKDADVRKQTAKALGFLGEQRSLKPLEDALEKEKNPEVHKEIEGAIKKIESQK